MNGTVGHDGQDWLDEVDDLDYDQDNESLASLEDDEHEQEHPPEAVIAELTGKNGIIWYLIKWQDCPFLRSSWEGSSIFSESPGLLDQWEEEKRRQAEGKSKPFDIAAFNQAVFHVERAERQRRMLRRLKRRIKNILDVVQIT
ncbi:chromo domain-containing protein [Phlyctema vagabunda]|uniref:Chromo domain-containing protein n=1 Tax=Phlyctema vagabunda TaxID=108571 RepID=A0ABR4P2N2_9HELO